MLQTELCPEKQHVSTDSDLCVRSMLAADSDSHASLEGGGGGVSENHRQSERVEPHTSSAAMILMQMAWAQCLSNSFW